MAGKLIPEMPVTQTIESGKALAEFLGLKEELPQVIGLADGARLVLSSKQDCYYVATARSCSCKAGQYGRMCKHRTLEGNQPSKAELYQRRQRELRARAKAGMIEPVDSLKPMGSFKPVLE